jgi:hypothetical protein
MITANDLKANFSNIVKENKRHNPAQEGIMLGALTKACGSKENRYLVTHILFGKVHSADFLPAEWYALFRFCYVHDEYDKPQMKNAAGKWSGREELAQWCGLLMEGQARQAGQTEMFGEQAAIQIDDGINGECQNYYA